MNYGPGAIIDFRAGGRQGAPVSVVAAGLEQWEERAHTRGLANPQTVFEPRLQKKLGVSGFRLPPVSPDDEKYPEVLIGVRFPGWLLCPSCDRVMAAMDWAHEPGEAARYCSHCTAERAGTERVFAVPVRFITACQHGHLDDFPWHHWVRHRNGCTHRKDLFLKAEGAGLPGLYLSCPKCKARRSMEKIFKKASMADLRCRGRRPWLSGKDQGCSLKPVVLQRGASNLYFPQVASALDIPPWSDQVQYLLGQYWQPLLDTVDAQQRAAFLGMIWPQLGIVDMTLNDLTQSVEHRIRVINEPERQNLRWDEYQQLAIDQGGAAPPDREFEVRPVDVPPELQPFIKRLVRVVRLREVRALTSFSRIEPPSRVATEGGEGDEEKRIMPAHLSKAPMNWLPAIEVRGEGIFIEISMDSLSEWETNGAVRKRAESVRQQLVNSVSISIPEDGELSIALTARFLLAHTLAHVLMKQLSLECGYSSASLRERLYVGQAPEEMCGLLIYTATSDSDGTLGGLQRQGESDRFSDLFQQAIRGSEWCSSDPLCIEGVSSATEATNLAACHACVLSPETSCEEFNRFLDRGVLVGTPHEPESGFFRDLLSGRF